MIQYVSWLRRAGDPSQTHVLRGYGAAESTCCGLKVPHDWLCSVKRISYDRHGVICQRCLASIGELKVERQGGGARTPQTPTMRMEP